MSEQVKVSANMPKLRFPEFQSKNKWHLQTITDLLTKVAKPVKLKPEELYQEIGIRSHGKGIFHKELITGKEIGSKRVFWVEENAFVVNIVFAWELAVASTTEAEKGMIASHRFPMYKAIKNKANVRYLKYFFLTQKGKELLGIASPGGAGRNKTLGQKEFEKLEFSISESVDEQQKIADCLSSLDNLINTHTQKLDQLKAHKKGLMQQLFPAEGERVPKLRFAEFRDSGDWEIKPIGKVAKNLDSKRVPIKEASRTKGNVPYYGASGIIDYVETHIFNERLLCISEDGANLVTRTYPIAFSVFGKSWINNHAHVLRFKEKTTQILVENHLNSIRLDDYLTGMAQPKLNRAKLDIIPIPLPKPLEQQKIADCLSSLDDLITAQTQKIEKLKEHKKGLMQQLFPPLSETP